MTWLPSYLQHAYGLKLAAVGWFSVLPWLTAALMLWGTGYLSDWLLRRTGRLRVARSHMIWVTQLLAGLCILPVIFMHDLGVALVFITLAVGLGMSSNACFYAVNVDVARARSGTALGVMDTFFALAGFIAPVLTGWLVGLTGHYRAAFALLALLALSSVLAVLLFHHPDQSAKLEDSTDARAAP
jgi:nitrate/nitrite transporter NarK